LGHIVGKDGSRVDPNKIKSMQDSPCPKALKRLCGFLFLTSYYHNFFNNYGKIAAPLTGLLNKNDFTWNRIVDHSFQSLKENMCTTPILSLLDFTKTFVLECDASGRGIEAFLMQYGRPLAFTRKQLLERHSVQSIYEKEILDIFHAVYL
jgi:hypothetical protein